MPHLTLLVAKLRYKLNLLLHIMNSKLEKVLKEKSNPAKAKLLSRFFKTGKGEYG